MALTQMPCRKCGEQVPRIEWPNARDRQNFGILCEQCLRDGQKVLGGWKEEQ